MHNINNITLKTFNEVYNNIYVPDTFVRMTVKTIIYQKNINSGYKYSKNAEQIYTKNNNSLYTKITTNIYYTEINK